MTAACYDLILVNYASLLKAWQVCLEGKLETDIRARIIACDTRMKTFNFFFALHLSKRLFAHTDNLQRRFNRQVFLLLLVNILQISRSKHCRTLETKPHLMLFMM